VVALTTGRQEPQDKIFDRFTSGRPLAECRFNDRRASADALHFVGSVASFAWSVEPAAEKMCRPEIPNTG